MRISEIRLQVLNEGEDELSASVEVENPRRECYRIWFRGPSGCFGKAPLGDVFFAAFWVPAMFLQEPLEIEGEISRNLLNTAYEQLEPVFLRWYRHEMKAARVTGATVVEMDAPRAEGVGCLFSGGLDSLHSTGRNLESVSHLVHIQGFDIPLNREDFAGRVLEAIRKGARYFDRELIVIQTNVLDPIQHLIMRSPELGRPFPSFLVDAYFGSMLVAISLCLRGEIGRMTIPSSWSYDHTEPRGSHPLIEPCWSTSTLEVLLDGCESDRIDKAGWLLEHHPEVFGFLRVCPFEPDGGALNCGKCGKCMGTMMEMRLAGATEEHFGAFARPLDLERAKCHKYARTDCHVQDLLMKARKLRNKEITQVARIVLGEEVYWPRIRHRLGIRFRNLIGMKEKEASAVTLYGATRPRDHQTGRYG